MIFKKDCYVYIMLPGTTEFVTAGKFVVEETSSAQAEDAVGHFVYGRSYLAREDAVEIDPVELRLSDEIFKTAQMKGLFGAIRDASPDYWGRLLIEHKAGKAQVSEMEYLLNTEGERSGALEFGHSQTPPQQSNRRLSVLDLEGIQSAAEAVLSGDPTMNSMQVAVEKLLIAGTSMGGARPKAVIEDDNALWIAKFNVKNDRWNNALAEHAMLHLAHECGITAAESKTVNIAGFDVLLVKRFDRDATANGYKRLRMVSSLTILRTDDSISHRNDWSYVNLVEEVRRFSANPKADAHELFRRMVFNALITNVDDHPRNHAFIAEHEWRLSPAYDLTPMPLVSAEHRDLAMICGAEGRYACERNLLSECRRFLLEPDEAKAIIHMITNTVKTKWREILLSTGISEQDCKKLSPSFVYPGFFDHSPK
jgi:serine/threonine-protein kinase HipA